jgi:protein TonB
MKPGTVLLTVILFVTVMVFTAGFFITKKKTAPVIAESNVLPGTSLKEEKAAPAQQPAYKKDSAPLAARSELVNTYIKTIVEEGPGSDCSIMPPPIEQEDCIDIKEEDDSDGLMMCNLESEAEFPGGAAAWHRYLSKNMRYPGDSIDEEMEFRVVVKFAIDEEGDVCDVEAVSGSAELGAEAVRVIKQSVKWRPARQISNGRYVKSFKMQPITICVQVEE